MDIENTFTYHPPVPGQTERYEALREGGRVLAFNINGRCPDCREKSVALTKLQECIMWANAAIAINENNQNL